MKKTTFLLAIICLLSSAIYGDDAKATGLPEFIGDEEMTLIGEIYIQGHEYDLTTTNISGEFMRPGGTKSIAIEGNYAYVSYTGGRDEYGNGGFKIVNISDKTNPQLVGEYKSRFGCYARDLVKKDDFIYLAQNCANMDIVDISDVQNPKLVGTYEEMNPWYIAGKDNYLFLGSLNNGLSILDLNDPINPVSVWTNANLSLPTIYGNKMFAFGSDRDKIYDVSDPKNPILLADLQKGTLNGLSVEKDNLLYTGTDKIKVIDIEDINNMSLIGQSYSSDIYVDGAIKNLVANKLFAFGSASGDQGSMGLFDISQPEMKLMGKYKLNNMVHDAKIKGDSLYLAEGPYLKIYDLTDFINMPSRDIIQDWFDQQANYTGNTPLVERLKGKILLQVEAHGEAWYVNPGSGKRIYMKDGDVAYGMMRNLGLGITNADLEKIPIGFEDKFECLDSDGDGLCNKLEDSLGTDINNSDSDGDNTSDGDEIKNNSNPLGDGSLNYNSTIATRLKGKILLQVEAHGEAWYVNPDNGKRYYMPDGPSAYQIMRYLSLGITNQDLDNIEIEN